MLSPTGFPLAWSTACAVANANDTLWRTGDCAAKLPAVCVASVSNFTLSAAVPFSEAAAQCSDGAVFGVPSSALDNHALADLLQASNEAAAWINPPQL